MRVCDVFAYLSVSLSTDCDLSQPSQGVSREKIQEGPSLLGDFPSGSIRAGEAAVEAR